MFHCSTSICEYPQSPLISVLYVLPRSSPAEIPCQNLLITGLTVTDSDIVPTVSQCTLGQAFTTCLWYSSLTSRHARHALAPAPLIAYGSLDSPTIITF